MKNLNPKYGVFNGGNGKFDAFLIQESGGSYQLIDSGVKEDPKKELGVALEKGSRLLYSRINASYAMKSGMADILHHLRKNPENEENIFRNHGVGLK